MLGALRLKSRRWLAILVASLVVATALVGSQLPQTAEPAHAALSGANFDPGYIISDYSFFDKTAMSQADIQNFLNKECPTNNCVNSLHFASATETSNAECPGGYTAVASETAASILYKIEQLCGISAKVLLVTMQKEQGLVTAKDPSTAALRAAMGYACPDTAPCSSSAAGFFLQVYDAAWQFQEYRINAPNSSRLPVGSTSAIQYSPNTKCGTRSVKIGDEATRGLYIYTPYTPDAAALANLSGVGDSCSSYGNRNFWVYYNDWFGSPTTTVPPSVTSVLRYGGSDRFGTAVAVSQAAFPTSGVPVVYIANGLDYPDALSAGPAAAKQGGPILLVEPTVIPAVTLTEIKRLAPQKIVVVGGTGSVDGAVYTQLSGLAPSIVRIGGIDREDTSRDIATYAFGTSAPKVFIATGLNFPDALSAGAAAGSQGAPVLLVDGSASSPDAATAAELAALGTTQLVLVGGTGSITASLATGLAALPGITSVTRDGGADRYQTSYLLNEAQFATTSKIYLAVGTNYPDALAGAAIAGAQHAALYIVPPTCIPSHVLEDFLSYAPTTMTMLGGTGSLSASVGEFVGC